jgi:hypothetical protein
MLKLLAAWRALLFVAQVSEAITYAICLLGG